MSSDIDIHTTLRNRFGLPSFRGKQEEVIGAIMRGENVLAIMPTGAGKSLIYQLPAVLRPGVTVVVSPLISLQTDQVAHMTAVKVPAVFVNSTMTKEQSALAYRDLLTGKTKLLYLSPEMLVGRTFAEVSKYIGVSCYVLDECHCVVGYGYSFRPKYLEAAAKIAESSKQVVSLTATATQETEHQLLAMFARRAFSVFRSSFDRPNLTYQVVTKGDETVQIHKEAFRSLQYGSGIIYRTTRASVERTVADLWQRGIKALPYHGGMLKEHRRENHSLFMHQQNSIIVATIAFGMGIDKSDVRWVLHADVAKSIEDYYQESGRAGRDGKPSTCTILYSRSDAAVIWRLLRTLEPGPFRDICKNKLRKMMEYCELPGCRRQRLLKYFGEERDGNCGNCDECNKYKETKCETRH